MAIARRFKISHDEVFPDFPKSNTGPTSPGSGSGPVWCASSWAWCWAGHRRDPRSMRA